MDIKLKQRLYKFSIAQLLLEYEVFGILTTEAGVFYKVRCVTGKNEDYTDDEVLIHEDCNSHLAYVNMISDNDDSQYCYHTCDRSFGLTYPLSYYCLTKKEALKWYYKGFIGQYEKELKERKELLKHTENALSKYKEMLKAL